MDIETGFNQQKPPHRTVCATIDLTAAFDTVSHDTLISKIVRSSLPPAITRWLSCYLRGRQAATSFRGTKSSTRLVRTGVPQGSKLSPSLFSYYIADMPRPTPPVKRVCYADDITVWATGPKIPQLESMITNYLRDVSIYLKDNSLLISAPKSTDASRYYSWRHTTTTGAQSKNTGSDFGSIHILPQALQLCIWYDRQEK